MRHFLLATTILAPIAAHAATYTVVAPGTTPAAGQFASLNALAIQQEHTPFIKPGDTIVLPAGPMMVDDGSDRGFSNIGTPSNPVIFQGGGANGSGYTIFTSDTYVPSSKGFLTIYSSDVVVKNVIFMGAKLGASNVAGIRMGVNYGAVDSNGYPSPYNLTVENSGFIMNNDGILADDCRSKDDPPLSGEFGHTSAGIANENGTCAITVENSAFAYNGAGDGLSHGIYAAHIDGLTVTGSIFLDGADGHLIKSRALQSDIENNRLINGPFSKNNSLIDFPIGGNETVKNNRFEIGGLNYNGFIDYQTEWYSPGDNNPGKTVVISGNTFIDNYSANSSWPMHYTPTIFMDQSLAQTGNTSDPTHAPCGCVADLTFTGNTIYSPLLTPTNIGGGWRSITADASNTFSNPTTYPTIDQTFPFPWPPTNAVMGTLTVTANGFELSPQGTHDESLSDPNSWYPQFALWWNGQLVKPTPSVVTADEKASPAQTNTFTFQVPVIPGMLNYLEYWYQNPGCCLNGSSPSQGRDLNMLTATLNGAQPAPNGFNFAGAGSSVVATEFTGPGSPSQPGDPPPADTTPPVLATPAPVTVAAGGTVTLALSATDDTAPAAGLTYSFAGQPAEGTTELDGKPASTFTQAEIDAGKVTYAAGTGAGSFTVGFTVSDAAGNKTPGTLAITITAPAVLPPTVLPQPTVDLGPTNAAIAKLEAEVQALQAAEDANAQQAQADARQEDADHQSEQAQLSALGSMMQVLGSLLIRH